MGLGGHGGRRAKQRDKLSGPVRNDRGGDTDSDGQHHAVAEDGGRRFLDPGAIVLRLIHGDGADNPDAEDIRNIVEVRSQGRGRQCGLAKVASHGDVDDEHQSIPEHPQHDGNR